MEYRVEVTYFLEADSDQEALDAYINNDMFIDGHTMYRYNEDGMEIEVDESELDW